MERTRVRGFRAKAVVCLVLALLALSSTSRATEATLAAIDLPATAELPGVVVFPARGIGPHPITVLLHGMCGDAARSCSHFAEQVTQTSNLVCPRASQRCAGGGVSWPERDVAEAVEAAVARAKEVLPEPADESRGRTLIGYSLGAYRALRIAQGSSNKYRRVMLIGAKVALDPQLLTQNGVERVLLCAGAWDMMHDPMQREAARLRGAAVQTRFLDLGPVGHAFTPSFANYLPSALSWLSGA